MVNPKLIEAIRFSAIKHSKQRRKDADVTPYINHPIEVMHILSAEGGEQDVEILMAAVLHDTVEDTATSPLELVTHFGRTVAGYVAELTDNTRLPGDQRKQLQIVNASRVSFGAGRIKQADKIANMRDIIHNPPVGWSWTRQVNYLIWANNVVKAIPHAYTLDSLFDETYQNGLEKIVLRTAATANAQIEQWAPLMALMEGDPVASKLKELMRHFNVTTD